MALDSKNLSRLRRVADPREVWISESGDFTPWLAENIDVLADEPEMTLTVTATEVFVGQFRLDIQAEDEDGRIVIIENQLERTDPLPPRTMPRVRDGPGGLNRHLDLTPVQGRLPPNIRLAQRAHRPGRAVLRRRGGCRPDRRHRTHGAGLRSGLPTQRLGQGLQDQPLGRAGAAVPEPTWQTQPAISLPPVRLSAAVAGPVER